MKAEGASGDQPDLGVDRFGAGVGEAVVDGGGDPGAVLGDRLGELDERREATAARPFQPGVEQLYRLGLREPVDLSQLLLEQVGAIQPLVGLLNRRQLGLLAGGEVLGVLPQRKPGALQVAGDGQLPVRRASFQTSRRISSSASVASITT